MSMSLEGVYDPSKNELINTGLLIRENVGEQPVLTDVTSPQDEDPCEILGSTPEQDERDALALKLAGLIAKELIKENHSSTALTRVIDGRLRSILTAVSDIVREEEVCMIPGPMFHGHR